MGLVGRTLTWRARTHPACSPRWPPRYAVSYERGTPVVPRQRLRAGWRNLWETRSSGDAR